MKVNKLYEGDCFKITKTFPDNSFDLLLFDLPYNIGDENKLTIQKTKIVNNKEAWNKEFKDNRTEKEMFSFIRKIVKMSYRVLKKNGSLFLFFDRYKGFFLYPFYLKFKLMNKLVFLKQNPVPHFRKNNYRSGFEECFWFCKGEKPKTFNFLGQSKMKNYFKGIIGCVGEKETEHPTEKYKWMIKPILLRHSKREELIGDFFMGSGTTCVVSKELGRKYIGIELNPKWFKIAKKRVSKVNRHYDVSMYSNEGYLEEFI
jgi:DNA modification methylase